MKKLKFYTRILIYLLLVASTGFFMYKLINISMIPNKYIIYASIIIAYIDILMLILIFRKGKKKNIRSIISQIISVILSIAISFGSLYIDKLDSAIDLMSSNKFQTRAISVVVLNESKIKNEHDIVNKTIGYVGDINSQTMLFAITVLNENINGVNYKNYSDFSKLTESLYNKKVDAIMIDESFRTLIEDEKKSFTDDTRVIYQITKDESKISSKTVDVVNHPFIVYISGNDEYGELSSVSRSDVNMVAAVNPETKQILLVSIPRDTYYPLHMNGELDKFTHSGLYGLQESINTLQDMIDEDINYYVRMNFTSFMNIIDAIGGITINSPTAFTTKIGHYDIKEGENTLNSKEALAFVRERKSFVDGDFARGRNQQLMMKAVFDKICSPALLTSFSSIIEVVSSSIETNMSREEINALVELQISETPKWNIQTYQIIGDTGMRPCYSAGNKEASVVIPYDTSINKATEYINMLIDGETLEIESNTELNTIE